MRYKVNCQIAGQLDKRSLPGDADNDDDWTMYVIRQVESPICPDDFCLNGGKCMANYYQPEGYSCSCDHKYYGKQCENEDHDYDVIFPNRPGDNYIEMDVIKSTLKEFTFTSWFKIAVGSSKYPFLSYIVNGSSRIIDIYFNAYKSSRQNQAIHAFSGDLFASHIGTATIPVNDDKWHHLGFTWSGFTGEWLLFIDGVLWANRTSIFRGKHIPSGGCIFIGQRKNSSGYAQTLVGSISRANLWSVMKSGEEIEAMAKSPRNDQGNLINWFRVVDHLAGYLMAISPSKARKKGERMNYDITLGTDYAVYHSPSGPMEDMSACFWFKGSVTDLTFFFCNRTEAGTFNLAYGYGTTALIAHINHVRVKSVSVSINSAWHFLCLVWNGEAGSVTFYYDSNILSTHYTANLKTKIPSGEEITIGARKENGMFSVDDSLSGTMSQLNIWRFVLDPGSITAMSAGGADYEGDVLAWRALAGLVVGRIKKNSEIFLPDYSVLQKRTAWCNAQQFGLSCDGSYFARIGGEKSRSKMQWRCYCPQALLGAKYTYSFASNSPSYVTRHSSLISIN